MADLTDDDLREMGRMVVSCAHIEGTVRVVLASLMNLREDMMYIAFDGRTHSWILDALATTVALKVDEPSLLSEWQAWLRDAKDVNTRRNEMIHALWMSSGGDGSPAIASARLRRKDGVRRLTLHFSDPSALTAVADDADSLNARIFKLMLKTPGVLAGSDKPATDSTANATDTPTPATPRTDMVVGGRIEPASPTPAKRRRSSRRGSGPTDPPASLAP
ncbi:MAG: hypothetical protein ACHQ4F_14125 [Candidatus Dormibacteria bacterium]